jgi:hypothetical protein
MTKKVRPAAVNSPASGLRESVQAGSVGATRPGEIDSAGPGTGWTAVVASPPGRSTKATRAGSNRNATRMLPPGWPPSVRLPGSISRDS